MCNKIYICETLGMFKKCIDEHIRDFKLGDFCNSLVKHNLEPNIVLILKFNVRVWMSSRTALELWCSGSS